MSRSLITHFSVGGTTAQVAQSIAAGVQAAGWEADLWSMSTDERLPDLDGYDLLGIGTPTYYFRPPFSVLATVNGGLPSLHGLSAFVFVLHGTYLGDTGNMIRRALAQKGAKEVGYFHCYGADFFLGYLREGYLFSPDHPTPEELARARQFGQEVAGVMADQEYARPPDDPSPAIVYRLERLLLSRWLARQVYSRLFRVNRGKCTACGLCMRRCPTGNIAGDEAGHPVWGRECLLCLSCEMKCPEDAITSPVSWPLFRPAMMYNVHQASRDPSIDHVRVKHSRGRAKRV